jgi:hypothetical protein
MLSWRYRHTLRMRQGFAAAVLLALVVWQVLGVHVLHPSFHRHGPAHCGSGHAGEDRDDQQVEAHPAHGSHPLLYVLCGPCPICHSMGTSDKWLAPPLQQTAPPFSFSIQALALDAFFGAAHCSASTRSHAPPSLFPHWG